MTVAPALEVTADVAARLTGLGPVDATRFFGGAALKCGGVQFAIVMKGALYLQADLTMRAELMARGAGAFTYEGTGGKVTVARYYAAPAELFDDDDALRRWALRAWTAARRDGAGSGRRTRRHEPASTPRQRQSRAVS